MATYLWRKYVDYVYTKWEKTLLWDMVEPYRRPKSFTPLVTIYVCVFYTGVIGAAITEQLYKILVLLLIPCHLRSFCQMWADIRQATNKCGPDKCFSYKYNVNIKLAYLIACRMYSMNWREYIVCSFCLKDRNKEKYWEEHPGQEVPLMKPIFYGGPWRVMRGDVPPMGKFDL